jgi:hypothetical protein
MPGDPRGALSVTAQRRIADAHADSDLIRARALAKIEVRYRSERKSRMTLGDYCEIGPAAIEWSDAKMQSALAVLVVMRDEFIAAGRSRRELLEIMEDEAEGAAHSLELTKLQRNVVWQELGLYRHDSQVEAGHPPKTTHAGKSRETDERRGGPRRDFMAPFLTKDTLSGIATRSDVGHASLHRWINGKSNLHPSSLSKLAKHLNVASSVIPN